MRATRTTGNTQPELELEVLRSLGSAAWPAWNPSPPVVVVAALLSAGAGAWVEGADAERSLGLAPAGRGPHGLSPQGVAPAGRVPQGLSPHGLAPAGSGPHGLS